MDASFEDLVADSLERRATEVRIPADIADLARRARRQHRRRQYFLRSGLTVATAAGLAVAIPLATQAGPQPAARLQAQTAAYVVGHTERSIATTSNTDIEVARVIWHDSSPNMLLLPHYRFVSARIWTYGAATREEFDAAGGRPLIDEGSVNPMARPGRKRPGSFTGVNYSAKAWWHESIPATNEFDLPAPPAGCNAGPTVSMQLLPYAVPFETASRQWLRYDLRCGYFRLAGGQHVAGINAIKIVSSSAGRTRPGVTEVIWVSPATYLPVQSRTYLTGDPRQWSQTDYRWLPVTSRNLALLSPPIPAAFRRVAGQSTTAAVVGIVLGP
jgi:hypothetical protein